MIAGTRRTRLIVLLVYSLLDEMNDAETLPERRRSLSEVTASLVSELSYGQVSDVQPIRTT